jgi:hypothetical protein
MFTRWIGVATDANAAPVSSRHDNREPSIVNESRVFTLTGSVNARRRRCAVFDQSLFTDAP